MKTILAYLDYRAWLQDAYEARKSESSIFSYRFIAGRLELDPGQLVKILQGKLHLPLRVVPAVTKLFRLDSREERYLEELVRFSRAKGRDEINRRFETLMQLKGVESLTLDDHQTEFYLAWRHTVVRALLGIAGLRGDPGRLGALCIPPITEDEARSSVDLLERLGLAARDTSGSWHLTGRHLSPGEGVPTKAIRQFQTDALELAQRALDGIEPDSRDISTITMALSWRDLPLVQGWIADLRRQIQSLSQNTTEPDTVYHLNVQLFPVARRKGRT